MRSPLIRLRGKRVCGLVAAACLLGCEDPNVGIIHGNVRVDGAPVESGSIAFFPTDGMSFSAGGAITDGAYASRVPIGKLRVEIRVPEQVGEKPLYDAPDSPVQPILEETLPARFNNRSELRITVEPGRSEHNFDLSTEPDAARPAAR